ncbi:MAG TPA: GNAT family N-acetyltransferase [Thermomicrobiales bacterium]|nr:GNAT family N-acetyltransferase [Thermomicrobiales bacterium]
MHPQITFRPLVDADLPAMKRWLEDPDVAWWYQAGSTAVEALREHYRDEIAGTSRTRAFIIGLDGRDAGYIQCYAIDDEPKYAQQIKVDPGAVGIDLFIGESWARNRGYGRQVLRAFLAQIVFVKMGAEVAIIAPEPGNTRAVRSYERAGFVGWKIVYVVDKDAPQNTGQEYIMRLTREAFESGE